MKSTILLSVTISTLIFLSPLYASPNVRWELPMNITDENTEIKFEVDTTWHVVFGKVSGISGNVLLRDPKENASIQGEIQIPVKNFSTGWDARDESLLDHMNVDKFPKVIFKINRLKNPCQPSEASENGCKTTLLSNLSICDISKDVEVDAIIKKVDDHFEVTGSYPIQWAQYNVDDPSIIVAKVNPTVTVHFKVKLKAAQ